MKLEGWKEQLISKAGKEILLKMVVQAFPQYAMSIFKITVSVCKAMRRRLQISSGIIVNPKLVFTGNNGRF